MLAATPSAVWNVLADFGALSAWADDVDHSCLLEHDGNGISVGTTRRVQIGRNTLVERITEIEPPSVLGYAIEGVPRGLAVSNRWTLAPQASNYTEVTLTTSVRIGRIPLAGLIESVLCRLAARPSGPLLAGLAKRLEGQHV
jgi:hypothetical protein